MEQVLSRKPSQRGFTLIELLVVIAIIALLAAILFPVFGRARENARRSSCQSNLKQIGLGIIQYSQDYDEKLPLTYNQDPGTVKSLPEMIQPYVKSTQLFRCPSDSLTNTTYQTSFRSSYIYNYYLGPSDYFGVGFIPVSLAAISQTATTVYASDGALTSQATSPWVTTGTESQKTSCLIMLPPIDPATNAGDPNWCGPNPRHLETGNVLFVDGHVKAMKTDKWYYASTPWLNPAIGGS